MALANGRIVELFLVRKQPSRRRRLLCLAVAILMPAYKADAASTDDASDTGLQEIVVTAERRSESLTRTPLAVSVLSQSDLTSAGISATKDLTQSVPNLQIAVNGAGDSVVINLRGVQSSNAFSIGDPAVALYTNGISIPAPTGLNGGLYDLSRIEVLRGPQGTLYGKNATAGSLNIITAPPTRQFGGEIDVSYGSFNEAQLHGILNIPVSDTWALRAAIMGHTNDGYFDTNHTTRFNYDRARELSARVTSLLQPSDGITWQLTLSDYNNNGTSNPGILTDASGRPVNGLPVYDQVASSDPTPYGHINNLAIQSRLDIALSDAFSLTYLAGYGLVTQDSRYVNLGVPLPCTMGSSYCDIGALEDLNRNYSHELDLSYASGRLKNIAGAIYLYQTNHNRADFTIYNYGVNYDFFIPDYYTRSYGVFDQATFSITDQVRVTGGLRYSHDDKRARGSFIQVCAPFVSDVQSYQANPSCPITAANDTRGNWSATTFKVGLDADIAATTLAYVSISSGYKAGGLNDVNPFAAQVLPPGYQPEKVINYELGLKTRQWGNALQLNLDAFYMDYSDLQVTQVQQPVGYLTINAATAKIYGLETEATFRPTSRDSLSAFANILHATYGEFQNAADQYSGIVYPSLGGHHLPNAPDFSAHIRLQHDFDFAGGSLSPSAAVYYQSQSFLREFNLPIDHVPAFTKSQINLRYQDATRTWSVEAYADNLENKAVRSAQFVLAGAYLSYYNPPRTYGLRVGYSY